MGAINGILMGVYAVVIDTFKAFFHGKKERLNFYMKTFWLAHVKQVFSDKWHHYFNMHAQLFRKKILSCKFRSPEDPNTQGLTPSPEQAHNPKDKGGNPTSVLLVLYALWEGVW